MAATTDPPLQLSDIAHVDSHYLQLNEPTEAHTNSFEDADTEPLTVSDISTIRRRLTEMGFEAGNNEIEATPREKELLEMVRRHHRYSSCCSDRD